jgi:hypothetical protein
VAFPRISTTEVIKDYAFKGAKVEVKVKYKEPIELIATVVGPKIKFNITEKTSKYGIWGKGEVITLKNQESFYHIYASNPFLSDKANNQLLNFARSKQQLGKNSAFYNYMVDNYFYAPKLNNIDNNGDDLMSFSIDLPPNCSEGNYEVTLYLFAPNNQMFDQQKLLFTVSTSGIYKFLKIFSKIHPFEYTSLAIFTAIIIGFIAGFVNNGKLHLK